MSSTEAERPAETLTASARHHLDRLMASWGVLADFSFSDLLLFVPSSEAAGATGETVPGGSFAIVGQMRPATSQTLFPSDRVGEVVSGDHLVADAWSHGAFTVDELDGEGAMGPLRREAIPVRCEGEVVAVLVRVWAPRVGRRVGGLERVYRRIFERLASMVGSGLFPFPTVGAVEDAPRVGDGVIVLDEAARISFASPNAVNALHRLGIVSSIVGARLVDLGVDTRAVAVAFSELRPGTEEFERQPDVRVIIHCIPLVDADSVVGAAVMLRDVTDLRRRDRLLLSKDAAIREVHHRVKNNLQTISSLLRLQSRRLGPGEAQTALEEAERRIRSIAVVHDALSREPNEFVPLSEVVPALVELAQGAAPVAVKVRVHGEVVSVSGDVATPLAVVIAELFQNAAQHACPEGRRELSVDLAIGSADGWLRVEVSDDGRGLPEGFDLDQTTGLGLTIVRDLVRSQLGGTITAENGAGAVFKISVPLASE